MNSGIKDPTRKINVEKMQKDLDMEEEELQEKLLNWYNQGLIMIRRDKETEKIKQFRFKPEKARKMMTKFSDLV